MRPFLTAEWRNLIMLTYRVEPELLLPYLPKGLELDMIDQQAFVSFVAFDFLNTKVKGLRIPFHINFPEINLRFYVRQPLADGTYRRGVVFVKELVPKFCIANVANRVYNEPYEAVPMESDVVLDEATNELVISHHFTYQKKKQSFTFKVINEPYFVEEDSTTNFFKEHEWGFGQSKQGKLLTYKVEHPVWRVYPIEKRFQLNVDYQHIYGEAFDVLNGKIPYNIFVAEGSAISVFPHQVYK